MAGLGLLDRSSERLQRSRLALVVRVEDSLKTFRLPGGAMKKGIEAIVFAVFQADPRIESWFIA